MIKEKVKKALRSEEIDALKDENKAILEELRKVTAQLDLIKNTVDDNFSVLQEVISEQKEYISSELIRDLGSESKVLVCGFYGARNMGDEMMLGEVLKILEKKGIKATVLLSDNYDLDTSRYMPHYTIHYPRRSSDITAIVAKFDVIIWGGGAVLDDTKYWFKENDSNLSYCLLSLSKAMIKKGGKVIVLGVSSNSELNNKQYLADLSYVIEGSVYFSLRDTFSLEALRKSGVRGIEKIKIINDLALAGLKMNDIKKSRNEIVSVGVVYVMRDDTVNEVEKYTKCLLGELEKKINADRNAVINFFSFYDYRQNDARAYGAIIERIKGVVPKNITINIIDTLETMDDVVYGFMQCDYLVSMRYHATLIACCLGLNVLSINLSPLHQHYANKLEYVKEKYCKSLIDFNYGSSVELLKNDLKLLLEKKDEKRSADEINKIGSTVRKELDDALKNIN